MLPGEPNMGTASPQPHRRPGFDAAPAQALSGLGPHGPVIYAWERAGAGAKERLVRRLLAGLPGLDAGGASGPDRRTVILEETTLGQPLMKLGGQPGPAVSFSRTPGCLWAALTLSGQVGVDAALTAEFEECYPFPRAFRPGEWDWARTWCRGDSSRAAALLWALKEAAVKALGVGFHFLDPLEVEAFSPRPWQGGWRVSVKAGRLLPAWARPVGGGWLAIARHY